MARIDHLVFAVPDLAAAVDQFHDVHGVRPALGGQHVGRGTHNALVSFGSSYLELIAPDPAQPEPDGPRPFGVTTTMSPAFVAFAVRPAEGETIEDLAARLTAAVHDPGPIIAMHRATPDGDVLRWRLTMPAAESPAVVPFLIDWGGTPQPSETQPRGVELTSMSVQHPDPDRIGAIYATLGLDVSVTAGNPSLDVVIS